MKGLADPAELEGFVEFLKESAAEYFLRAGRVLPHAMILATRDPINGEEIEDSAVAIPCLPASLPQSGEDYSRFIAGLRAKSIELKAVGVIVVAEAWCVAIDGIDPATVPELNTSSFGGRRREAVMVTVDHLAFKATVRWAAIIDRVPSLGLQTWKRLPAKTIMRERFTDAFPRELWQ